MPTRGVASNEEARRAAAQTKFTSSRKVETRLELPWNSDPGPHKEPLHLGRESGGSNAGTSDCRIWKYPVGGQAQLALGQQHRWILRKSTARSEGPVSAKAYHDIRLSTSENAYWLRCGGINWVAAVQPVDAVRLPELFPARNACQLRPCLPV